MVSSLLETLLMLGQATGNTDSFDSPRPGLGGNHHLPPYSILCVVLPHLHLNGFYSKLSWFRHLGLWELITPGSDLGLGWRLKQTCISLQELSNCVSHFSCTHRDRVNCWLFVVGSQIVSLTLGFSFDHNLCCRCPNGSCKANFDIYTFNSIKNASGWDVLTSTIELWSCGSLEELQVPTFGNVSFILTLASKWGCDIVG